MSDYTSDRGAKDECCDNGDEWNQDDEGRGDTITQEEISVRDNLAGEVKDKSCDCGDHDALHYSIVQGICPICMKELTDGVLVKSCLHEFCYDCIAMWSKHLATRGALPLKCPVCRSPFQAVLANLRSEYDYDTVNILHAASAASSIRAIDSVRRRRSLVYRRRVRPTTEWQPIRKSNDQARPWIDRELRVLMGEDADTSLLLHVVLTYVDLARQHQANSHRHPSAKHAKTTAPSPHPYTSLTNTMRDFLHEDAELFVHEVAKFMASRVNMAEYDRDPDPCAHDATDRQ